MPGQTIFDGEKFTRKDDSQADSKDLKAFPELAYNDQEIEAWVAGAKDIEALRAIVECLAKMTVRAARLTGEVFEENKAAKLRAGTVIKK